MTVTFVTAFFIRPDTPYRSVETYKELFEMLAASGVNLLLFLCPSLAAYGEAVAKTYPNVKFGGPMEMNTQFLTGSEVLPSNRHPVKDSVSYMCIQLMKLPVMAKAADLVRTSHIAWIDFGMFHMVKNKAAAYEALRAIERRSWPTEHILSPGCWPRKQYEIWENICWRHCGTFLLGERSLFAPAAARQMELVRSNLPRITWEINYWSRMEEYFKIYDAIHDESILINSLALALE